MQRLHADAESYIYGLCHQAIFEEKEMSGPAAIIFQHPDSRDRCAYGRTYRLGMLYCYSANNTAVDRLAMHSHASIVSVRPLPLSLARCCQQALLLCMPLAAAAASSTVAVAEPTCRRPMEGSTCFFFSILRAFPFVARSSVAPAGPSALLHCIALHWAPACDRSVTARVINRTTLARSWQFYFVIDGTYA